MADLLTEYGEMLRTDDKLPKHFPFMVSDRALAQMTNNQAEGLRGMVFRAYVLDDKQVHISWDKRPSDSVDNKIYQYDLVYETIKCGNWVII